MRARAHWFENDLSPSENQSEIIYDIVLCNQQREQSLNRSQLQENPDKPHHVAVLPWSNDS